MPNEQIYLALNNSPLKAGMTISNEPGYYADGRFGIRIESIVLVREVNTPHNFGDKGYLGFEHVTMCAAIFSNRLFVKMLTLVLIGARYTKSSLIRVF